MPESRHRPGHTYQKKADIPGSQRVKGRIFWAILFAVFGLLIGYFATGANYAVLLAAVAGAAIGYVVGRSMERDAKS